MEKPPLEKVLEKLEKLDTQRWEWKHGYLGPAFTTRIGDLKFYLEKRKKYGAFADKFYYALTIQNIDGSVEIEYFNIEKQSVEEKELSRLHTKLYSTLKGIREKRFEESIDEFLSE